MTSTGDAAPSGSLFGGGGSAGKTLFGATPAQTDDSVSASKVKKPVGNLFGTGAIASSEAKPVTTGGGLFGNGSPAPSGGGLFGNTTSTPASGGGLFGPKTTNTSEGGGLFGSIPKKGGTLFG